LYSTQLIKHRLLGRELPLFPAENTRSLGDLGMTLTGGVFYKHRMTMKGVRPRDENDGVVDMALAFVGARQNSHPLLLLDDILPLFLSS